MMAATLRRSSGIVVPHQLPWHRQLVAFAAASLLRVCLWTWRCHWKDTADYPESRGPVIYCIWHNRLPLALASYDDYLQSKWPDSGLAAMISASRDGGLLASVLERFGVQPVRGSTSRRGPQALLEATTWMERNYSVAITPDGPRGPVYQIQDGIIQLAKLTGRPILPTSNFTRWKIRLNSWDRFQIPLPFARCELRHGAPLWVPRDASEADCEQLRLKLEQAMRAITRDT
ncbi:MAG: lysophospholipid acyltransferase family protein [Verrucomicrobiota bacterium]|jgi:lysophospholipid acyltransferase (LPLAT)-like uncharacterized protein